MKKIINEKYVNPLRSRFVLEYNAMTEEQQHQFDLIETLPKEKKYLKYIKRKRLPDVKIGTIFVMLLPENIYMYGKIIAKADNLPMIDAGNFVAMISRITTKEIENFNFDLTETGILCGPWIIGEGFWKNGTFFTVCEGELSKKEKKLDIGFYEMNFRPQEDGKLIDKGFFIDLNGKKIRKEPKFLNHCAYITIVGIEEEIRKHVILGDITTLDNSKYVISL